MFLRRQFTLAALVAAVALAGLVPSAQAATVEFIGPAGAEVVRDGQVIAVLPLDAPIELPHAQFMILEVRKPGYTTHEEQVFLENEETALVVDVEMLALDVKTAVVSSALLAGTGQLYQGRKKTGMVHMGLQLAAWGAVVYGEWNFKDKRDEYEAVNQDYHDALVAEDIARLRGERDTAWNEMEDARTWRNVGIGTVIAIAAWSTFDAWRGHNKVHAAIQSADESPDGTTTAQLGLTWGFGGGAR